MTRLVSVLLFAAIGAALALLDTFYLAGKSGYVPDTFFAWLAWHGSIIAPWTLLGALIGFITGGRTRKPKN